MPERWGDGAAKQPENNLTPCCGRSWREVTAMEFQPFSPKAEDGPDLVEAPHAQGL